MLFVCGFQGFIVPCNAGLDESMKLNYVRQRLIITENEPKDSLLPPPHQIGANTSNTVRQFCCFLISKRRVSFLSLE